jgi:hypothetical protein
LKAVYTAADEAAAREALETFGKTWDGKYPMIYRFWEEHWTDLCEYFKYSPEIRRAIYTSNAIESLNYQLGKVTKNRSTFSTDDTLPITQKYDRPGFLPLSLLSSFPRPDGSPVAPAFSVPPSCGKKHGYIRPYPTRHIQDILS